MMQPTRIRHSFTPIHRPPAKFLFYKVLTQENATSFLKKSSSPFSLQELRPLTPLKETDRFTSLMVIGMMKIMCNTYLLNCMASNKGDICMSKMCRTISREVF
jgi:hypothetical protein